MERLARSASAVSPAGHGFQLRAEPPESVLQENRLPTPAVVSWLWERFTGVDSWLLTVKGAGRTHRETVDGPCVERRMQAISQLIETGQW